MKLYKSFASILLVSVLASTACSRNAVRSSSTSATAMTANSALNSLAPRPFGRHMLAVNGQHSMSEFMLPDVRSRLDEEPVGDTDGGYDPSTIDPPTSDEQSPTTDSETPAEDAQPNVIPDEDANPVVFSDQNKFLWAKKSFGEAVKARPTNNGVIVLYADENYYDITRLMAFIEDGRSRIAERADIEGSRIQVVFGGYRGVPQVELWVIPEGGSMPEFRTEDRLKPSGPEN